MTARAAGAELYKEVKRASDSHIGVPSQCFVTRKASIGVPQARGRPQYCSNLVRA
jgi:eukaryotic translation initiation factor 2C